MQFTTVRSKENDYYIYLKSEKLVHSNQEVEKNACQLFGSGKKWFLVISSLTNTVGELKHCWRERKVDTCYLETKKCSSQLLGTSKKIITYIYSQKNWFTAIRSTKNFFPSYLEVEKTGSLLASIFFKLLIAVNQFF